MSLNINKLEKSSLRCEKCDAIVTYMAYEAAWGDITCPLVMEQKWNIIYLKIVLNERKTMASKKRKNTVYLIPKGETRDNHTYHYTAVKTKGVTDKLELRKYNPVKRKHELFVEVKLPPHS